MDHDMNIFKASYVNNTSTFWHGQMVFKFLDCFVKKVSACFLETCTYYVILTIVPEAAFLLCHWWISLFASLVSANFSSVHFQIGFRNNFEDHRRLPVCIISVKDSKLLLSAVGSLKRVTENMFSSELHSK